MRKLLVAALILFTVAALWAIEGAVINSVSNKMTDKIELVEKAIKSDKLDEAMVYANEFYDEWEKESQIPSMITPHEVIEEIGINAARLKSFSSPDGRDDALASAMEIRELLKEMVKKREVSLMNIL